MGSKYRFFILISCILINLLFGLLIVASLGNILIFPGAIIYGIIYGLFIGPIRTEDILNNKQLAETLVTISLLILSIIFTVPQIILIYFDLRDNNNPLRKKLNKNPLHIALTFFAAMNLCGLHYWDTVRNLERKPQQPVLETKKETIPAKNSKLWKLIITYSIAGTILYIFNLLFNILDFSMLDPTNPIFELLSDDNIMIVLLLPLLMMIFKHMKNLVDNNYVYLKIILWYVLIYLLGPFAGLLYCYSIRNESEYVFEIKHNNLTILLGLISVILSIILPIAFIMVVGYLPYLLIYLFLVLGYVAINWYLIRLMRSSGDYRMRKAMIAGFILLGVLILIFAGAAISNT